MTMVSIQTVTKRALAVAGGLCALLAGGSALAEIRIAGARITEGQLWALGQADEPNAPVTLDDAFEQTTDNRGRFEFHVVYHPATCIVTIKTAAQAKQAVVASCGQAGPKGDPGPEGRPGPPGQAGPSSPAGSREVRADDITEPRVTASSSAQSTPRPQEGSPRPPSPQAGPAAPEAVRTPA